MRACFRESILRGLKNTNRTVSDERELQKTVVNKQDINPPPPPTLAASCVKEEVKQNY